MSFLSSGFIAGILTLAAAIANAFHLPALSVFFADPETATTLTNVAVGVGGLVAGFLRGVKPATTA